MAIGQEEKLLSFEEGDPPQIYTESTPEMANVAASLGTTDASSLEREALRRVLQSPLFQRAPNLSRILEYICEQYFEGTADKIKEYNIAVEALGRSAGFDPQLDAIVRVDLYLLRKRLNAYYSHGGKHDEMRIVLRSGSYVPEFMPFSEKGRSHAVLKGTQLTPSEEGSALPTAALAQNPSELPGRMMYPAAVSADSEAPRTIRTGWLPWLAGVGCGLLVLLTTGLTIALVAAYRTPRLLLIQDIPAPAKAVTATILQALNLGSPPDSLLEGIRIRCGSTNEYVDTAGLHWQGDRDFTGGSTFARPVNSILRSTDPALYSYGRQGAFQYDIPVRPGTYEVHLFFAETQPGIQDGMRQFPFTVGLGQADNIDIASDAGGANSATERVYADVHPGEDGAIHLSFMSMVSELNAIEILPDKNAKPQPVRISTQLAIYQDISGGHWLPDRFYRGGMNTGHEFAHSQPDPPLFSRERYGNFDYDIAVARGYKYKLTLFMTEHYWGGQNSGSGGVGSRIFSVRCNGMNLLTNFDILATQKGNGAIAVQFHDLEPDEMGQLRLSFLPVVNYPLVNDIEVEAE